MCFTWLPGLQSQGLQSLEIWKPGSSAQTLINLVVHMNFAATFSRWFFHSQALCLPQCTEEMLQTEIQQPILFSLFSVWPCALFTIIISTSALKTEICLFPHRLFYGTHYYSVWMLYKILMDFCSFPSVIISIFQTGNSGPHIKLWICSPIWEEAADLPHTCKPTTVCLQNKLWARLTCRAAGYSPH